ncbi:MAG: agmatine deiminase family protein [Verrucomicrobiota bacterium]
MKNLSIQPLDFDFSKYHMPAEWEPHEATWLAWPVNEETWPEQLQEVHTIYGHLISQLTPHETVHLLIPECERENLKRVLDATSFTKSTNLVLHHWPYDDSWMRDAGPIFIKNKTQLLAHDFIFNTWGEKYGPWDQDDVIPQHIAQFLDIPYIEHDLVLEGGSIDVNGSGIVLTTEQCLLHKNRNPQLNKETLSHKLKLYLGCHEVIWLKHGIEGDDTDGHIDDITRFVNHETILTVVEHDAASANYQPLKTNLEILQNAQEHHANKLQIIELPMPDKALEGPFGKSPATYANFYIANNIVLVPVYSAPNEDNALQIFAKVFPDRKIIPIECSPLVHGLGSIHCITQQQPAIT